MSNSYHPVSGTNLSSSAWEGLGPWRGLVGTGTGLKILPNPDNPAMEPSCFDVQLLMHVPRPEAMENSLKFHLEAVRQLVETP